MQRGGKHPAPKLKRAQILLAVDASVADVTIAGSLPVGARIKWKSATQKARSELARAYPYAANTS